MSSIVLMAHRPAQREKKATNCEDEVSAALTHQAANTDLMNQSGGWRSARKLRPQWRRADCGVDIGEAAARADMCAW